MISGGADIKSADDLHTILIAHHHAMQLSNALLLGVLIAVVLIVALSVWKVSSK